MEDILFDISGAWTFSKFFPYAFIFTLFYTFAYFLFRNRSFLWKYAASFLLGGLAFGIYFAFNVIYISDIENNYREYTNSNLEQLKNNHFYVLSIPGCEYCKESIGFMQEYVSKSEVDSVTYLICDSLATNYSTYTSIAPPNFAFKQGKNIPRLIEMADFSFPSFVYVDGKGVIYAWSNNDFGVRAKDFIKKK